MRHLLERFDKLEVIRPIEFDAPNGSSAIQPGETVTLISVHDTFVEIEVEDESPFYLPVSHDQISHGDCYCAKADTEDFVEFDGRWIVDLPESTS